MVEVATRYGIVRVKVAYLNGQITNAKPEFDDCTSLAAAASPSVTLREVQRAASTAFWAQHDA